MSEDKQPIFLRNAKTSIMDTEKTETMRPVPARRTKPWAAGFSIVALCYMIWAMLPTSGWLPQDTLVAGIKDIPNHAISTKKLVPFEAHIMSKCPDARDCLKLLVSSCNPTLLSFPPFFFGLGILIREGGIGSSFDAESIR